MTLTELVALLVAACVTVPLFRHFGFGSVLGYLAAGIGLGPFGLALVDDVDEILHMAEFGVVLLLFIIGLELKPSRLWVMRKPVFGLGTAQVLVSSAAIAGVALAWGLDVTTAIIVGLGLALSSTAFVLQILAERKELTATHGRASFSVLLFQDLAAIPIIAAIPLLGSAAGSEGQALSQALLAAGVIAALVLGGRYLLRPAFRIVTALGGYEMFTAASLLVVVGSAYLMYVAGVSMALGAFLAGVLLADSEFRHQLEAEIEPFKGLLLGLFFVAVGMSADMGLVIEQPMELLAATAGLLALKGLILYAVGWGFRLPAAVSTRLAFTLCQGGEFAFVIFAGAVGAGLMQPGLADFLIMVVTLSMLATPFLYTLGDRLGRSAPPEAPQREYDAIPSDDQQVIIAGMGRFGQIVARVLHVRRIPFTAIESDVGQVDFIRHFNASVYYGNVTNLDLLRAAHVDKARIFVIAVQDAQDSVKIAELVKTHFPGVKIYARARNRRHAHLLINLGVDYVIREAFVSSLEMTAALLGELGDAPETVEETLRRFRRADEALLVKEAAVSHEQNVDVRSAEAAWRDLENLFDADELRAARREREAGETA